MKKAILKIIAGLLLILGGVYGVNLVYEGIDELGKLDEMVLDLPAEQEK